jgi:prepilin peptidase dependent protein C
MLHKKGFSLLEVLVSLFLMSTIAFSLIQLQCHAKQLLSQFISHVNVLQYREEASELFYANETAQND